MTVEEARAALEEAQQEFDNAKGKGVSVVTAASKKLSAAKRALAAAEKAEAAGVNVSGLSRAEQLSTIRQAEYAAAQEEAGRGEKPTPPPPDEFYTYDYIWRSEPGGRGGYWSKVQFPRYGNTKPVTSASTVSVVVTDDSTDTTGYKFVGNKLYYNGVLFSGVYNGQTYKAGVLKEDTTLVENNQSNADLLAIIQNLQNTVNNLSTKNATSTENTAAVKAAQDLAARQSAFDLLYSEMDAIGLAALVEPLRGLIQKNVSPSEFAVQLKQTEAYKMRFAANDARLKKGLRVLQPGEYIKIEDGYRQTLRMYGLKQFDNDAYVRQFIENDVSPGELSERVAMAVQRVQNADPAITRTLRDYYGIGQQDLVAYVLDPNQQLQKIQRQIAAAEIGTAARVQNIQAGVGVAEQLAAQGISQAEAQKGYATIADILPTAEKLSQIYGTTLEGYDLAQAEQEVFNSLASAQRRRQRLTQREVSQFSGQSGVARGGLAEIQERGQFQNPERTHRPRQRNRPIVGASQFPRTELWPATNNEQKGGTLL